MSLMITIITHSKMVCFITETGELATVIGWGETSSGGPTSRILQEVNVTVVSNTKCKKAYDEIKLLVNRQTL